MKSNPLLLLLETATSVCSIALAEGDRILSMRTSVGEREHASMLTIYIQEVMEESGKDLSQLDAVVVSKGPGSYTGLRIGVATAKGICFSLDKPLIAIDTPLAMAYEYKHQRNSDFPSNSFLIPVIDARRMEVYGAAINLEMEYNQPIRAEVLQSDSFIMDTQANYFIFGDAAFKCVEVYESQSLVKVDTKYRHSAFGLLYPGLKAWNEQAFEYISVFEPYYLKEFVAKVKSVKTKTA
jgi:tRNA threonylcarbamoyladenosine biosynthesis protein TsaB